MSMIAKSRSFFCLRFIYISEVWRKNDHNNDSGLGFFSIHCSVVVQCTATIDVAVIFAAKLANVNAALSHLYIGEVYVCGCGCLGYHKWVTAIFVQSKIFCSWMRLNGTKFGWYQNVEFEKSFELYRQTLVRVLTKVALNFIHFECYC